MKKVFLLLTVLFLFNNCKSDDDSSEEQIIDGGEIFTAQIIKVTTNNISQDEYQATLNDQNITVFKYSDTEIGFMVPPNFNIGETQLNVPNLNNLKINYIVSKTLLQSTPEITIRVLTNDFDSFIDNAEVGSDTSYVNTAINSFKGMVEQLNDEDLQTVAEVYQANKAYFDSIFALDLTIPQTRNHYDNLSDDDLFRNFGISVIAAGISTAIAIFESAIPIIAAPFAIAALLLWKKSHNILTAISNKKTIKTNFIIDALISELTNRNPLSSLEFENNIEKTLPFEFSGRPVNNSDTAHSNSLIGAFFDSFNTFNGIINKLNSAITLINDHVFFSNIPLISNEIIEDSDVQNNSMSQEIYDSIQFSVSNNNLEIQNRSFNNGNLSLTFNIIDTSLVTDLLETELTFSFSDNFNEFSGSFPINVNLESDQIDLSGNWLGSSPICESYNPNDSSATFNTVNNTVNFSLFPGFTISTPYVLSNNNISFSGIKVANTFSNVTCTDGTTNVSGTIFFEISFTGTVTGDTIIGAFIFESYDTPYCHDHSNSICSVQLTLTNL